MEQLLESAQLTHVLPLLGDEVSLQRLCECADLSADLKARGLKMGDRLRLVNAVQRAREKDSQSAEPQPLSAQLAALAAAGAKRAQENVMPTANEILAALDAAKAERMQPPRFMLAPSSVRWDAQLAELKCGAVNTLGWSGGRPLPSPPPELSGAIWLLPCTEELGEAIAKHRDELRDLGWRVIACADEELVAKLGNKVALRSHARSLGLSGYLPAEYPTLAEASYPAILKAGDGTAGDGVYIVDGEDDALRRLGRLGPESLGTVWTLQELVRGRVEHSVSLIVEDGSIKRLLHTTYEYARPAYVWPRVRELSERRRTDTLVPPEHVAVLEGLLVGYTGLCNVNYKVRGEQPRTEHEQRGDADGTEEGRRPTGLVAGEPGQIALFEVNTRVGGDLANDAEREQVRALFEWLDGSGLGATEQHAGPCEA